MTEVRDMSQVISGGPHRNNRHKIEGIISMSVGKEKQWLLSSLLEDLPSYLLTGPLSFLTKVGLSNNLINTPRKTEETVYDILNAGPRHRFTVMGQAGPFVVSNCVQSTGHDIHMKAIRIFAQEMHREKIPFTWIICDFHDQFIVEVDLENAQKTKDLISSTVMDILNKELGGVIPIKGDPQIVRSMSEVKIENFREPE